MRRDRGELIRSWMIFSIVILIFFIVLLAFANIYDTFGNILSDYGGLGNTTLVTISSGLLVIWITYRISGRFGQETVERTVDDITNEIRASLSAPIADSDHFLDAMQRMVEATEGNPDMCIVGILSDNILKDENLGKRKNIVSILSNKFQNNQPALLGIPENSGLFKDDGSSEVWHQLFWEEMTEWIDSEVQIRQNFAKRDSYVIPLQSIDETALAVLENVGENRFEVKECLWGNISESKNDDTFLGIRSMVNDKVSKNIIDKIFNILQEPRSTYSNNTINYEDLVSSRKLTGIPITRSIITSQILLGVWVHLEEDNPNIETDGGVKYNVWTYFETLGRKQISYITNHFIPPLVEGLGSHHSGSILAKIFDHKEDGTGKSVWEVGCGSGYDTVNMVSSGVDEVLVIDINPDAVSLTRRNVNSILPNSDSDLNYWVGDASDCDLKTDDDDLLVQTTDSVSQLYDQSSAEINCKEKRIDIITMDLPLIPYHGKRHLSVWEKCYMEKDNIYAGEDGEVDGEIYDEFLPKTIAQLLRRWSPKVAETDAKILLPFCAVGTDERREVREAVESCCADSGLGVELVSFDHNQDASFVQCFELKS